MASENEQVKLRKNVENVENDANVKNGNPTKQKLRSRLPDKPIHKAADSLLSSTSNYTDYRGFFNLCVLLLILSNGRVALENVIKYGILINPRAWIETLIIEPSHWPAFILLICSNIFIVASLWIEIKLSRHQINEQKGLQMHFVNMTCVLLFPAIIVWIKDLNPVGAGLILGVYSIILLKLVSYIIVNSWCRTAAGKKTDTDKVAEKLEKPSVSYPDNLNLKDMYYYMFIPTLCYELNFPRTTRIRKKFLLKRVLELVVLSQLIMALIQQWMVPTILNSRIPFQKMDYSRMLERLLKLAIPNHLIWLIMFYWLFHAGMNFAGELLKFADREFYKDWWNAETIQVFWQHWNIPVHRWCLRHLYIPLLKMGYHKQSAQIIVFCISAFFHEYLVSIPLKMFRIWAFMGMVAQVPLALFVERFLHGKFANIAMWLSLIIGQPLAILMYCHDYYILHQAI